MTEQQYRVIADRDKGDKMPGRTEVGDRITQIVGELRNELVRIERPVLTTDEVSDDPWIFDGSQATARERAQMLRAVARDPREDDALTIERGADLIDALLDAATSVPTREQIAEVLSRANVQYQHGAGAGSRSAYLADAVLALLNGADR